jgi:hypothetical protein
MDNKYTYDDWWNGEVAFENTEKVIDIGFELKIAFWEDFSEIDALKIKDKQRELFEELVQKELTKGKDNFLKQFQSSLMKGTLLENEIQQCHDIMYAQVPNADLISLNHWDFSFPEDELVIIQRYVKRNIERGIDDGYDYIHSPFFQHQNKNKIIAQVYAKFIWLYHGWLENNFTYENSNEEEKKQVDSPFEVKNKHPHIFKNGYAYQMFLDYIANSPKIKNTELARFGFIFHKMKDRGYILQDVKHLTFIEFLNNSHGTDISAIKFSKAESNVKEAIFSNLLEKYESLINKDHQ